MPNNRSISDIRPPKRTATVQTAPIPEVVHEEVPVEPLPTQPIISPEELMPVTKGKSRKIWIILGTILVLIIAAAAILLFWMSARG